jgi:predicted RNA-binding Zn ribbon-like protein
VIDLALLADFLNTRDERVFGEHSGKPISDRDQLQRPRDLGRWLASHGLATPSTRVSAADFALARQLRDGLRDLLAGGDQRIASPGDLAEVASELSLTVDFGAEPVLLRVDSPPRAALAQLLAACATAEAQGRWARLKMCSADDCNWVFYDTSRNRLGRWCAMDVCGNRVKTSRYRARQRRHRNAER